MSCLVFLYLGFLVSSVWLFGVCDSSLRRTWIFFLQFLTFSILVLKLWMCWTDFLKHLINLYQVKIQCGYLWPQFLQPFWPLSYCLQIHEYLMSPRVKPALLVNHFPHLGNKIWNLVLFTSCIFKEELYPLEIQCWRNLHPIKF